MTIQDPRLKTSSEMHEQRSPALRLAPPFDMLGRLTLPFSVAVTGPPGSGKSTWALALARTLADVDATIYVTPEEGHSDTFGEKVRRLEVDHDDLFIADVHTPEGILELVALTGAKFVVLDSATHLDATSKAVTKLWRDLEAMDVSLVALAHLTTTGTMKGGTFFAYDLGALVRIEDGTASTISTGKNRYGELAEAPVAFTVDQLDEMSGGRRFGFTVLSETDEVLADSVETYHRNPAAAKALNARTRGKGSAALEVFVDALKTGTIAKDRRTRLEVRGFYTDPKGRPAILARDADKQVYLVYASETGLIWRANPSARTLDTLTEVSPSAVPELAATWHENGGDWAGSDEVRAAMFAAMKERGDYDPSRVSRRSRGSRSSTPAPAASSSRPKVTKKTPARSTATSSASPDRKTAKDAPAGSGDGAASIDFDQMEIGLSAIETLLANALK